MERRGSVAILVVALATAQFACVRLNYPDIPDVELCEDALVGGGSISVVGSGGFAVDSADVTAYLGEQSGNACVSVLSISLYHGGIYSGCSVDISLSSQTDSQGRFLIGDVEIYLDSECGDWASSFGGSYRSASGAMIGTVEPADVRELDYDTCYTGTTTITLNQVVLTNYLDESVTIAPTTLTVDGETYGLTDAGPCP